MMTETTIGNGDAGQTLAAPVRRHPDCAEDDCRTYLDDHTALAAYIQERIGGCNDWLMQYRKWLDAEGILAEVNGWASRQAFDEKNVSAFIKAWCS
jgi:hypothetical protein